ncbi:MAG: LLM class flavin-dependent oxidoreductase [Chloroflexi bacterium]|nr:LLM class flavin-dependent oxidoreductase [Chloroflexota bacterium]
MKFGTILLWGDDFQAYVRRLKLADELGYDLIGVGDSQSVYRDLYVALAVAAQHTSRAVIGPLVTNPVTRHPAVTASAIATIDELSHGRALLGIGTGGSAVLAISEEMATQASIREYIIALRQILQGKTAQWQEKAIHTQWVKRPIPVHLSAYGAKAMRLAGEVADGVIIASSSHPTVLKECLEQVHQGAQAAGRDPASIDVWIMVRGSVRDTRAEALADIKALMASAAKHAFRSPMHRRGLSPEMEGKVAELRKRYQVREHVMFKGSNAKLIDELGLTELLADRLSVAGTPEECKAKLRAIRDAGVNQVIIPAVEGDPDNCIRRFATEVFPEFRTPATAGKR